MNKKTIIIIGATSGIGRALFEKYAVDGNSLGIVGRRENLLDELYLQHPDNAFTSAADITKREEIEQAIHMLCAKLKHIDLAIVCSGTGDLNPSLDYAFPNVLRISRKFVFELPSGIKHSLIRSYANALQPSRSEKLPKERCRLHFLLAWFHAVIGERLRYVPIGWSKYYEFNESDQRCALEAIDEWINIHAKDGEENISPNKIPWDAIKTIIHQSMYGGKIDNEYDMKILELFG